MYMSRRRALAAITATVAGHGIYVYAPIRLQPSESKRSLASKAHIYEQCEEPSCGSKTEMRAWLQQMQGMKQQVGASNGSNNRNSSTRNMATTSSGGGETGNWKDAGERDEEQNCPLDRAELGNKTWSLVRVPLTMLSFFCYPFFLSFGESACFLYIY